MYTRLEVHTLVGGQVGSRLGAFYVSIEGSLAQLLRVQAELTHKNLCVVPAADNSSLVNCVKTAEELNNQLPLNLGRITADLIILFLGPQPMPQMELPLRAA